MIDHEGSDIDVFGPSHMGVGTKELRNQLKRSAYLRHLLETHRSDEDGKPHDAPVWEAWLKESGELPPDVDALPINPFHERTKHVSEQ